MSDSIEKSPLTPMPPKPQEPVKPEAYGAISGLWITAGLAGAIGIILFVVSINIEGGYSGMSVSDLATKIALSSLSGASLSIGVICGVAAAVLQGVREMLRRYRNGDLI